MIQMTIILSEKRGVSMLKIDRHSYILNELKKKHLVRVNRLANDMKVTEMTIRRDLKEFRRLWSFNQNSWWSEIKTEKLLSRRQF